MQTLLQTLLIETLPAETDSILRLFIEILPAIEREFGLIPALGGSEEVHYQTLLKQGDRYAREKAQRWANKPDQSLLVHVLNALMTAWNLIKYLPRHLQLSEIEKRLLCLGLTLHDYNKYVQGQGEEAPPPKAHEIEAILELCQELGEKLNFQDFWADWQDYLLEIAFLAQNTQFNVGTNTVSSNWETDEREFTLDDRRLDLPLRHLLAFGDIAVHMNDPADVVTKTGGDRLRDHLDALSIRKKLVYHRLRDCRGLLTNQIHNAVVQFAREIGWEPILYFAQGAVYLAPQNPATPDLADIQSWVWQSMIQGDEESNQKGLESYFETGDVGFVRDGKGLKVAPQTLEFFTPTELIRKLPNVVKARVANVKDPATPKRLQKLTLSPPEREMLARGADIRADRIAEFLILTQREFFEDCEAYAPQVLTMLELQLSPEQTAIQSGGVNYGWYRVAAHYVATHSTLDLEQVSEFLSQLAERLSTWAEENGLLKQQSSPTQSAFFNYLAQYLEVSGCSDQISKFQDELATYAEAKVTNQPICSLSSGEAAAEDQLDSVVLFKPQQYSNKNALGGGRIKRGISKIWSLEMLLRQAYWAAPSGKLEDQQPVFLSIFPAYVYSPQTAIAVRRLVNKLKKVNLWEVRKQWLQAEMQSGLQNLLWRDEDEAEAGRYKDSYSTKDLPFLALIYTTTRGKTVTDAWVEPAFLALALPMLLGVKVVATSSPDPLYASDQEFLDSVILDGAAGFWNLLDLSTSLRLQDLSKALERLLVAYSLHLECRSSPPDARWQAFSGTVREMATNILNVFSLTAEGLRENKRDLGKEDVKRVWNYAQIWAKGNLYMQEKLKLIERLVREYRTFYQVNLSESSHAVLLPISKALEVILTVPEQVDSEDLILQGAGQLKDALERREVYNRPFLMNKSVDYATRQAQELVAIHAFMSTCVNELFGSLYKGDRALLQENRNRIKSGAEFAYRWLALQEKQSQPEPQSKGEAR